MTIRAVLFDRDGVLTYFDIEGAASALRPILPISIYELAQRWQAWGSAVGFPADLAQERQFFAQFWDHLSETCDLSAEQREQLNRFSYPRYVVAFPDAARRWLRCTAAVCASECCRISRWRVSMPRWLLRGWRLGWTWHWRRR